MRYVLILFLALLAACGGGGGGEADGGGTGGGASGAGAAGTPSENLSVVFPGYLAPPVTAFREVSVVPNVSGLDGHRPNFRVSSGRLPAGLSLDSATGAVSGVPTEGGTGSAQIELTVDGFSGAVSAQFSLIVNDTLLSYTGSSGSPSPTAATTFEVGLPLRPFTVFMLDLFADTNGSVGLGRLLPATGVTIAFRVAEGSTLPTGLRLDTATGEVLGTPAAVGAVDTKVEAVVNHAGTSRIFGVTIPFSITAPTATLTYSPRTPLDALCISSQAVAFAEVPAGGTAVSFTPTVSGMQAGDVLSGFSADAVSLHGLSLNPDTGVISGTSFAPNNFCGTSVSRFEVTYTLTRGGISNVLTSEVRFFQ